MIRKTAIVLIVALLTSAAYGFGLGQGNRFGKLGSISSPGASGGGGCSPTGLIFNTPCNSMYATVIHF